MGCSRVVPVDHHDQNPAAVPVAAVVARVAAVPTPRTPADCRTATMLPAAILPPPLIAADDIIPAAILWATNKQNGNSDHTLQQKHKRNSKCSSYYKLEGHFSNRPSDRAHILIGCEDIGHISSHLKKLTHPTPGGFRGLPIHCACVYSSRVRIFVRPYFRPIIYLTVGPHRAQIWHACADS